MTQTDKEKYLERRTSSFSAKKADIFCCSCVKYGDAIDVFGCALHDREDVVLTDADLAKLDELRKTHLNLWRHIRIIGQANLLLQEEVIELNARAAAVAKEARVEEAKWWVRKLGRDGDFWVIHPMRSHPENCRCEAHARPSELEQL